MLAETVGFKFDVTVKRRKLVIAMEIPVRRVLVPPALLIMTAVFLLVKIIY